MNKLINISNYWETKTLSNILVNINSITTENNRWIIGLNNYKEEDNEGRKKIFVRFFLKKYGQWIPIKEFIEHNVAFYDEEGQDIFIQKVIKYWSEDFEHNNKLTYLLLAKMYHFKYILTLSKNQRYFFKLLDIKKIHDKFFKQRQIFLNNTLTAEKENFKISKSIFNTFTKLFIKKVIWSNIYKSKLMNTPLKGFVLDINHLKGIYISLGFFNLFFIPKKKKLLKKKITLKNYILFLDILHNNFIMFKIETLHLPFIKTNSKNINN